MIPLLRHHRIPPATPIGQLATLTANEKKVLELLIDGKLNKQIATELDLGLRTVEMRRAKIFSKLQAGSLAELIRKVMIVELAQLELNPQA